jgi:hypothetical protein
MRALLYDKNILQVLELDSGIYQGDVLLGKLHGEGKFIFLNGETYNGEWKNNKMHGRGTYVYKDGSIYEGEYRNGKKHGIGMYTANGETYVTHFNEGVAIQETAAAVVYDAEGNPTVMNIEGAKTIKFQRPENSQEMPGNQPGKGITPRSTGITPKHLNSHRGSASYRSLVSRSSITSSMASPDAFTNRSTKSGDLTCMDTQGGEIMSLLGPLYAVPIDPNSLQAGVGMVFRQMEGGGVWVSRLTPGGPAEKFGAVGVGDIVKKVCMCMCVCMYVCMYGVL